MLPESEELSHHSKEQLIHIIQKLNREMKHLAGQNRFLKVSFAALFLIIFTFLVVFYLGLFNKQTTVSPQIVAKATELSKQLDERNQQTTKTYSDSDFGWQVAYNPTMWDAGSANGLPSGGSTKDYGFTTYEFWLKDQYGHAQISITSYTKESTKSQLEKEKKLSPQSSTDDLETLVNRSVRITTSNTSYVEKLKSKEKIKRSGFDMVKLTYSHEFVGQTIETYKYEFLVNGSLYVIDTDYPKFGNSGPLAEGLIDSITFTADKTVLGATDTSPTNLLDDVKIVELVKPSTVNIVNISCFKLSVAPGSEGFAPEYKFCQGAKGSGFIISQNGYVGTNGHVAKMYPEEALIVSIFDPQLKPFMVALVKTIVNSKLHQTITDEQAEAFLAKVEKDPSGLDTLAEVLYALMDKNLISLSETGSSFYVKLGNEPITLDKQKISTGDFINAVEAKDSVLPATVVDFDFPNVFTKDAIINKNIPHGSDVAILKINAPDLKFPALKLGSKDTVKEGSQILVLGYPGLVQGDTQLINYEASSAKPTITKGIVSAFKTDLGGKTLIQTDASIDHGNSGGPAFNNKGEVIGIATYGIESVSGNYNLLRDIQDLKDLMTKNSIINSDNSTYLTWGESLNDFWTQYYKDSVKKFDDVKLAYRIHPTVDGYVTDAQAAIDRGEDKTPIVSPVTIKTGESAAGFPIILVIVGGVLALVVIGGIILVLVKRKKSPREIPPPQIPQNPYAPPQQQTPVQPVNFQSQAPVQMPQQPVPAEPSQMVQTPYSQPLPPTPPVYQPPPVQPTPAPPEQFMSEIPASSFPQVPPVSEQPSTLPGPNVSVNSQNQTDLNDPLKRS